MKWILILVFASGAYATKEFPDEQSCEIGRSIAVKRMDIAFWLNPEHPTTAVRFASCEHAESDIGLAALEHRLDVSRLPSNRAMPHD